METHKRWFCRDGCKREWIEPKACFANSAPVSVTGNPVNGVNCIYCGCPDIELIEYKPQYPGLDIPRDRMDELKKIPIQIHAQVGRHVIRSEGNVHLLGRDAQDLITSEITNHQIEVEKDSVYDLSDMD